MPPILRDVKCIACTSPHAPFVPNTACHVATGRAAGGVYGCMRVHVHVGRLPASSSAENHGMFAASLRVVIRVTTFCSVVAMIGSVQRHGIHKQHGMIRLALWPLLQVDMLRVNRTQTEPVKYQLTVGTKRAARRALLNASDPVPVHVCCSHPQDSLLDPAPLRTLPPSLPNTSLAPSSRASTRRSSSRSDGPGASVVLSSTSHHATSLRQVLCDVPVLCLVLHHAVAAERARSGRTCCDGRCNFRASTADRRRSLSAVEGGVTEAADSGNGMPRDRLAAPRRKDPVLAQRSAERGGRGLIGARGRSAVSDLLAVDLRQNVVRRVEVDRRRRA